MRPASDLTAAGPPARALAGGHLGPGLALREDRARQGKGELAGLGLEVGERDEAHAVAAARLAEPGGRAGGARRLVGEGDDGAYSARKPAA